MQENKLIEWDYDESVKKIRPLVLKWKTVTIEMLQEIYTAREVLDGRKFLKSPLKVQNCTFGGYIRDIGLEKRNIYNWLEKYSPEEQKLLTDDELEQKRKDKLRKEREKFEAQSRRVNEYKRTGKKPDDWDEKTDAYRLKKEKEDAEYEERKRKMFEERQRKIDEVKSKQKVHGKETEDLLSALEQHRRALKEKDRILSKMRLTGNNSKEPIYDALFEYLIALDESTRLEACHNIIKFCKGIAAECQIKSVNK